MTSSSGVIELLNIPNSDPQEYTRIFAGDSSPTVDDTYDFTNVNSQFITVYQKVVSHDESLHHVPLSVSMFDSKYQGIRVLPIHLRLLGLAFSSRRGPFQKCGR